MKTIHKFEVPIGDAVVVELPKDAFIVHADFKLAADQHLSVWYERDEDDMGTMHRSFIVVPTGAPYIDDGEHVATAISANRYFVAHLIEVH